MVLSLLLISACGGFAQSQEIIEKPDPPLGVTSFTPKKIHVMKVNQGLLKLDSITWRVYPVLYQALDKTEKQAAMKVEISGPMNGGFSYAPLTLNLDGQISITQVSWTNLTDVIGNAHESVLVPLREETFRKMAKARNVDLTVLLRDRAERYTVHLSAENLANFGTMLSKYDTLDPKRESQSASKPSGELIVF
jgi:hypothetical protein